VRGTLAVLLNPGAWLFLATAASSLFASAVHADGRPAALAAALALSGGLMLGDGAVVLLGGVGMRRAGMRTALWIRRALALILAGLGVWLVITGFIA
jgi:threonine/homoserine/homoserine lactone efflux protein